VVRIRDHDLGSPDFLKQVLWNQFAVFVIAVRIVRLQNTKTILDRKTGRDNKKSAREVLTPGAANSVNSLPRNEHRHNRGLAGAGGELQRETLNLGVGVPVRCANMLQYAFPGDEMRRDLSKPDDSLNGLDLTTEWASIVKLVMAPMLQ
jgi:hypothetical protein